MTPECNAMPACAGQSPSSLTFLTFVVDTHLITWCHWFFPGALGHVARAVVVIVNIDISAFAICARWHIIFFWSCRHRCQVRHDFLLFFMFHFILSISISWLWPNNYKFTICVRFLPESKSNLSTSQDTCILLEYQCSVTRNLLGVVTCSWICSRIRKLEQYDWIINIASSLFSCQTLDQGQAANCTGKIIWEYVVYAILWMLLISN